MGLGLRTGILVFLVSISGVRAGVLSPAKCKAALLVAEEDVANRALIAKLLKRGGPIQGVAGFPPGSFSEPISDFTGIARNRKFLEHFVFREKMRMRGIQDYEENLGPGFKEALANFPRGGHWVDMGAGEFAAQREFFANRPDVKLTAVSIIAPQHPEAQAFWKSTSHTSFRFLLNAVTDLRAEEITGFGQADLVTDVYGALTYEARIDEYLKIAVATLKTGGVLLLHTTKFLEFLDPASLKRWLLDIEGLEPMDPEEFGTTSFLRLKKVSDTVIVPPLDLVKFVAGSRDQPIPWRVYRYPAK